MEHLLNSSRIFDCKIEIANSVLPSLCVWTASRSLQVELSRKVLVYHAVGSARLEKREDLYLYWILQEDNSSNEIVLLELPIRSDSRGCEVVFIDVLVVVRIA